MAGPEIRAFEFARALSGHYDVTIAAYGAPAGDRDGIRVVPAVRRRLLREALRHDAVLAGCVPPYLFVVRALRGLMTVADLYDPHELELATLADGAARRLALRTRRASQLLQLRYADVVVCAAQAQRDELLALAGSLRRAPDPVVVPFGIAPAPGAGHGRPLRARFPQISERDTVVLWWGSVWRWLDAELAVRALAALRSEREDLKLVISAGRPPNAGGGLFDATADVRALAAELGVLDRTVLFLDDWIPYERRLEHLRDADIGLTLHRSGHEARVAARARYMDYLSARLPCVLGRGDEVAEEFAAAGFATLVDRPDPPALAALLVSLADDPAALQRARERADELARRRSWETVGEGLRAAVASARPPRASPGAVLGPAGRASAYYALRVGEGLRRAPVAPGG